MNTLATQIVHLQPAPAVPAHPAFQWTEIEVTLPPDFPTETCVPLALYSPAFALSALSS